ncbi:MAG: terminase large subunit [Solirubrobacteraceae bacterium]
MEASPTVADFTVFARACGLEIEPWQERIVAEILDPDSRETVVSMPRGGGKTSLMAIWSLFRLLFWPSQSIYCAAASREQAALLWRAAAGYARHPRIAEQVTVRHLEIRRRIEGVKATSSIGGGRLAVLASDAPKLHGLTFDLAIVDELAQHRDSGVYDALRSALHKTPTSKLIVISTAAASPDAPLARLRARALAQPHVERDGALTYARGPSLRLLEWAVPDDGDVDDPEAVKQANPASWLTLEALADQREALPDIAFRRFIANQISAKESAWLPPGAWQACVGVPTFTDGESVWVGVDVGGERSASAVVWVNGEGHVGCSIFHGDGGVLDCADQVRELAERYRVVECAFDPWRFGAPAAELERERLTMTVFPQSDSRMIPCSQRLYDALVQGDLVLPDDELFARHAADAIARHGRRGWRLDKAQRADNIDALIALAIANERRAFKPEPIELVGFV